MTLNKNPPKLLLSQHVNVITGIHINIQYIPEDDGWTYLWD